MKKSFLLISLAILELFLVAVAIIALLEMKNTISLNWGNCTPPCPPGLFCAQVIISCSEVYAPIVFKISSFLALANLLILGVVSLKK